jgi:hypothetical protein
MDALVSVLGKAEKTGGVDHIVILVSPLPSGLGPVLDVLEHGEGGDPGGNSGRRALGEMQERPRSNSGGEET